MTTTNDSSEEKDLPIEGTIKDADFPYTEVSLYIFSANNPIRQKIISIVSNDWYFRVSLFCVLLNSVIFACAEYDRVDANGNLKGEGSYRNQIVIRSEIIFLVVFIVEWVLGVIAMGFYDPKKLSYMGDRWHWLDTAVVIAGLISLVPGMSTSVTALRVVRSLRALKAVPLCPGLRVLVVGIFEVIPGIANVMFIIAVVFAIFGVGFTQVLSGPYMHSRCRLTPYPVKSSWVPGSDYTPYRCLEAINFDLPQDNIDWGKATSPWATARDCYWPIDKSDEKLCGLHGIGTHSCGVNRWCGSNFDAYGNFRFISIPKSEDSETFIESLNYGYTNFDNIFKALFTVFQVITLEGWSDITYMVQNSYSGYASYFFVLVIVLCYFLVLQLFLAILDEKFSTIEREIIERDHYELNRETYSKVTMIQSAVKETMWRNLSRLFDSAKTRIFDDERVVYFREQLKVKVVESKAFKYTILFCVLLNSFTLSLNHYPSTPSFDRTLEASDFILAVMFFIEFIFNLTSYGHEYYAKEALNFIDGFLAIVCFAENCINPPSILTGAQPGGLSVGTAFRAFRILRIFRLLATFPAFFLFLGKVANTVSQTANFIVVFCLLMFIYSIMGMQFFDSRLRFDEYGHPVMSGKDSFAYVNAFDAPRLNFDNFAVSFATCFTVVSGENWNVISYNLWRAKGAGTLFFTVSLVVLGSFILLNLFLALIIQNFGLERQKPEDIEKIMVLAEKESKLQGQFEVYKDENENDSDELAASEALVRANIFFLGNPKQTKAEADELRLNPSTLSEGSLKVFSASPNSSEAVNKVKIPSIESPKMVKIDSTLQRPRTYFIDVHAANHPLPSLDLESHCYDYFYLCYDTRAAADYNKSMERRKEKRMAKKSKTLNKLQNHSDSVERSTFTRYSSGETAIEFPSDINIFIKDKTSGGNEAAIDNGATVETSKELCDQSLNQIEDSNEVNDSDKLIRYLLVQFDAFEKIFNDDEKALPLEDTFTLGFISNTSSIRYNLAVFIDHPWFGTVMQTLILVSSIALAIDNPLDDPNSVKQSTIEVIDYIISFIFAMEMCIKIVVFGIYGSPQAYISSAWNCLDATIVLISFVTLFGGSQAANFKGLRVIRSFKALRPLRMLSHAPGMKLVINSTLAAMTELSYLLGVSFIISFIFALFGLVFFKGQMRSCHGDVFDNIISQNFTYLEFLQHPQPWSKMTSTQQEWFGPSSLIATFTSQACSASGWPNAPCCSQFSSIAVDKSPTSRVLCECWGGYWDKDIPQSFDNIFQSLGSFAQISTASGWTDMMFAAVDRNGIDMQPIRNNRLIWVWFFMACVVVCSWFLANLFIGVVVDSYAYMRVFQDRTMFLTEGQKEWVKTRQMCIDMKALEPLPHTDNPYLKKFIKFSQSARFEILCLFVVVMNVILMAMQYFGQNDKYADALNTANFACSVFFTLEVIIKVSAEGTGYFKSIPNFIDFAIVVVTDIATINTMIRGKRSSLVVVSISRCARLPKLLKLIGEGAFGNKGSFDLIRILSIVIPSMGNVICVICLVLFIFTTMGVQLFAKVAYNGGIDDNANFRSFGTALLTLLRIGTLDNWNTFMADGAFQSSGCVDDPPYDARYCGFSDHPGCIPLNGCGFAGSYAYIAIFVFVFYFVLLNLFIGVVLEGYQQASDFGRAVEYRNMQKFQRAWARTWSKFMAGKGQPKTIMELEYLPFLLRNVSAPLGYKSKKSTNEQISDEMLQSEIDQLHLFAYHPDGINGASKFIHFNDVLVALAAAATKRRWNQGGLEANSFFSLPRPCILKFVEDLREADEVHRRFSRILSQSTSFVSFDVHDSKGKPLGSLNSPLELTADISCSDGEDAFA